MINEQTINYALRCKSLFKIKRIEILGFYEIQLKYEDKTVLRTAYQYKSELDLKQVDRIKEQAEQEFEVAFIRELAYGKPVFGIVDNSGEPIETLTNIIKENYEV